MKTQTQIVDLIKGIDFPHLRNGGTWRSKPGLAKLCIYGEQLRSKKINDAEIAVIFADLAWCIHDEIKANKSISKSIKSNKTQ